MKKRILLTNDDGFEARGLNELADALNQSGRFDLTVVAPAREKSASSHSLTLNAPLRFWRVKENFYKLDDATPADCVYLAFETLFKESKPDLVISGINHGGNLGEDVGYSGTVGAATEAVLQGVPALAVSQYYEGESLNTLGFSLACEVTLNLVKKIFESGFSLPQRQVLNLNIPAVKKCDFGGLQVAKCGHRAYSTDAFMHKNPRGVELYWLGTPNLAVLDSADETSDLNLVKRGFATLTPLQFDFTAHESLGLVERLL